MLQNIWEPGTLCKGCEREFTYGEEALYGRCLDCAKVKADERHAEPDTLQIARGKLAASGRLTFTGRQLRELVRLSGVEPVRKPDHGQKLVWYARMPGWSAARVAGELSAAEVAGLWLDFLDVGKIPPVRHCDLGTVLASIGSAQVTT